MVYALIMILPMLFTNIGNVGIAQPTASVDVPRDQSVWMMGYWNNGQASMNPLIDPSSVTSGVYFMYMPLFDTNPQVYTDYLNPSNLIPLLGQSVSWSSDGSQLNIKLRSQAHWSDGTPVNATDVVFSLNAYVDRRFSSTLGPQVKSIAQGATAQDVVITLNSGYYYSEDVYESLLIGGSPIVPQKVFQGQEYTFDNNWFFNTAFNTHPEWKIVDGPYEPYASTSDGNTHVYVRMDNWWMSGIQDTKNNITWRIPEPKYIVSFHGSSNFVQNTALANGQIDLFGGYIENVQSMMNQSTMLHTWTDGQGTPQYYPLTSAMNEVVFNFKAGYPLGETWFHKALAAAINYNDISQTAASGYLKQASASWIDAGQPAMAKYYNATIASEWAIYPAANIAKAYLSEGAYQGSDGAWYTLDAPAGQIWSVTNTTITPSMDQDPSHAGINLKLSGWNINCVTGWSDHEASLQIIVNDWKNVLNISATFGTQDYNTFITNRNTKNFQMYYSSLGNRLDATPLNFMQYFTSTSDVTRNVTSWYNPDFLNNLTAFSTATTDAAKALYMNNMQYILGKVMPAIPVAVNCYWYTYSDVYWQGWPNVHNEIAGKYTATGQYASRSDYVSPVTHWTTDHYGRDLMIINNLVKGPGKSTGGIPWSLPAIVIGLSGLAVATVVIRKKYKQY